MGRPDHDEILKNQDNERHISFSEFSAWTRCPFYHKLVYIDKLEDFHDSEFTVFGKAIHSVLEEQILDLTVAPNIQSFDQKFLASLKEMKERSSLDKKLVLDMRGQAQKILADFSSGVREAFPTFEVLGTEELLYEKIPGTEWFFKGYIDLVLRIDGKIVLLDWKSCSWGWDSRKKSDKLVNYQLVLYKYFYGLKHGIDPKEIRTFFGLLKRTAKKNSVEIFETTAGSKRIANATQAISEMLAAVEKGKTIKNRMSCGKCNFQNSQHCQRS